MKHDYDASGPDEIRPLPPYQAYGLNGHVCCQVLAKAENRLSHQNCTILWLVSISVDSFSYQAFLV